jgi:HSP20 family protein
MLEDLEVAAHDGRLERLPGIGPRRAQAMRDLLAARLSQSVRRRARRLERGPAEPDVPHPSVGLLLDVDREYREGVPSGELPRIAPRRFNPKREAWLPILHTRRETWNVTANGGKPAVAPAREWEPFRMMRDLLRWDPFAEMRPAYFSEEAATFAPAFEVKETNDAFVFKADVPGIQEKDLGVKIAQNRLTITGKREQEKSEKGDAYYTYERSYGSFTRAFTLPEGTAQENIKAELKEGVLTLTVPKKPELQPKKIDVKAG